MGCSPHTPGPAANGLSPTRPERQPMPGRLPGLGREEWTPGAGRFDEGLDAASEGRQHRVADRGNLQFEGGQAQFPADD